MKYFAKIVNGLKMKLQAGNCFLKMLNPMCLEHASTLSKKLSSLTRLIEMSLVNMKKSTEYCRKRQFQYNKTILVLTSPGKYLKNVTKKLNLGLHIVFWSILERNENTLIYTDLDITNTFWVWRRMFKWNIYETFV